MQNSFNWNQIYLEFSPKLLGVCRRYIEDLAIAEDILQDSFLTAIQKEEQLKQAEIEKNIAIQKAEGEAKALQIKGNSLSMNPKIIQLEWINKWDGKLPTYMMGNGQGVILSLPNQN